MNPTALRRLAEGTLVIRLHREVYSVTACVKAAHQISREYVVTVARHNRGIVATIVAKGGRSVPEEVAHQYVVSVTDYTLRERLDAETAPLRQAILAHAFSRTRLTTD
ncbi:MAG TPA: hypothetical protein VIS99_08440 [Terrimicrobiaceae bacterium]